MASPAAVLNILLTANTTQANAALAKTQAQLEATGAKSTATSATMKKAFVGMGLAAAGVATALFKIGEEFDDASDKIRTRTGATGKELKKLEGSFKKTIATVPVDFDTASEAVAGLNQRLGITGKPLTKLSRQFSSLSKVTGDDVEGNIRAVSRAFVDWEVKTKDQSRTLDGFFRLSQKTGISVSDIAESVQQFGSPLRQLGIDLDQAAAMFANFEKAGVNTSTMVPGLKLALANLNAPVGEAEKQLKAFNITIGNAPKGLQEVFKVLGDDKVKAVDRISLAMATFGRRAGADMKEAIEQGRFQVDKLMETFRDGEGTIGKSERATRDFSEQWTLFKNNLALKVAPVAQDFFKGIGDLMKDVTKAFKKDGIQGVIDVLVDKLNDAAPKILEAGAKIAGGLVKGILGADVWTKLLVGGLLFAKLGGSKAATALGTKAGKFFGKGWVAGVLLALPLILPEAYKFGQKLGHMLKKGLGGTVADFITGDMKATLSQRDVMSNFMGGNTSMEAASKALQKMGFTAEQAADKINKWYAKMGDAATTTSADVRKGADKTDKAFDDTADKAKKNKRATDDWQKGISTAHAQAARDAQGATSKTGKAFDDLAAHSKRMKSSISTNVTNLSTAIGSGMANIGSMTNKALKAFGVKQLTFNLGAAIGAGATQNKQRGGIIHAATGTLVPGTGNGDKVPAMLEPGEVVINKKAVAAMGGANKANAINSMIPRFATGGVIEQALGPYSIPPIQYDPNHAGGNSHLHLDFFTKSQAIAYGKKMQGMGWSIGEYSGSYGGFGPITTQHQSPGHYDGTAFDANTAQDETQSQVAAVARLIGGKGGAIAAAAEKIARQVLKGPDGPLKDLGQAALDKVRSAANKFVSSKAPSAVEGGVNAMPGAPIKSLPKNLAKWNKQYGYDSTDTMPAGAVRALAAWQGLPSWFWKIAIGESAFQPGAVGHDPGGTTGYGLYQETEPFANAYVKAVTGGTDYMKMLNPVLNTMAAKLHFQAAPSQTPNTPGFPWYGTSGLQRGGVVGKVLKLAKGTRGNGLSGSGPNGQHWSIRGTHGSTTAHAPMPGSYSAAIGLPDNVRKHLDALRAARATLDEQISVREIIDAFSTSELGSDLGPLEKAGQIALNDQLLANLQDQVKWIKKGIKTPHLKPAVRTRLQTDLNTLQGITGTGGDILTVRQKLDQLAGTDTTDTTTAEMLALQAQIAAAEALDWQRRYNVSQAQYGVFGGTPMAAQQGTVVQSNPSVNVNVGNGMEWLKQFIQVQINENTKAQARSTGAPGSRMAGF